MSNVTAFPFGLQGLLALKGQQLPHTLGDLVTPVVDLTQMYLLGVPRERIQITGVAVAGGVNAFTTVVPSGETWYVWNYICACNTGVGVLCTYYPAVTVQGNTFAMGAQTAAIASEFTQAPANTPFWADSGLTFSTLVRSVTGAATVNGALVISRLRT